MCVEKTPWEQTVDFHGHTCPEIALGFRLAQIIARELGIKPTMDSELLIMAERGSCALDALQVINHATFGNGALRVEESGKHIYHAQYTNTGQVLRLSIRLPILEQIAAVHRLDSARARQNKTLETIQLILSCEEDAFCQFSHYAGNLSPAFLSASSWITCAKCQDPLMEEYAISQADRYFCVSCAD